MRKTLLLSLFLCLGYLLNAQTNFILNPGFEDANAEIKLQTTDLMSGVNSNKWAYVLKAGSSGTVAIASDDKQEGNNSLKIDVQTIASRFNYHAVYEMTDVKPGKYFYSFWYKSDKESIPFRIEAKALSTANTKIENHSSFLIGSTINGKEQKAGLEWKQFKDTIDLTSYKEEDLKYVCLILRPNCALNGNVANQPVPATYWFDNFEFIAEGSVVEPEGSLYPHFAAISDIHVGRSGWEAKVTKTLNILKNQPQKLDAIFIVGDITENGKEAEFQQVKETISNIVPADIPVYYNLGNHDWWQNKHGETRTGAELFTSILGQDVNQYIEIKGYPFILISMENQSQSTAYQTVTRAFLTDKLKKAATDYPGKPIFVFQHVPNSSTVYGSYEIGGGDAWGTSTINDILSQYSQVISVSGHSHYFLADERSIHQDKYTSINDGSIAYAEIEAGLEGGTRPTDSEKIQEGVIFSLDANNNVTVKRLDFYNDREIKQPWVVKAPHDGTAFAYKNRTGGEKPYFESGAKVTLGLITDVSVQVTFPFAKDDDAVQHYRVEVLDANKNVLAKPKFKILSKFYLYGNTETSFKLDIADLEQDTEYYVQVTALDAFGQESAPALLSEKFKTDAYVPQVVEAPKANLIDVKFEIDTALNAVEGTSLIVEKGPVAPTVKYDTDIKQYVSTFAGSAAGNTTYYKIDYKNNDNFKNKVAAGFTFEVYTRTKGKGAISSVSSLQSGGIGLEQIKDGGATQLWMGKNPSGNEIVGLKSTNSNTDYYHIVATFDGTNVTMYYNGEPGGSASLPNGMRFSSTAAAQWIAIGGDASAKDEVQGIFDGEVALFRMYDRAISRDEINALYKQLNTRKNIKEFDSLSNMLETILPAYIAGLAEGTTAAASALLNEGKALMSSYATTEKEVIDFMARANALTGAPSFVYGDNLINNYTFEESEDIIKDQTTDLYTATNSNKWVMLNKNSSSLKIVDDAAIAYEGSKALELNQAAIANRWTNYLAYEIVGLTPGKYVYSFYAKSSLATAPFRVEIAAFEAENMKIEASTAAKYLIGSSTPSGTGKEEAVTNEWKKYSYEIDATSYTEEQLKFVNLIIRPNVKQGGGVNGTAATFWFDNFEFREVIEKHDISNITLSEKLAKGLNFSFGDTDFSIVDPMLFTLTPADHPLTDIAYKSSVENVATVKDGIIKLGNKEGTTEITIYSKSKPSIEAIFNIKVSKSKDVSLASVTVNGKEWSDLSQVYTLECGESKYLNINVVTNDPKATVDLGNSFGVQLRELAFSEPSEVRFVVTAPDGITTKAYNLLVLNNSFAFGDIIHQKFNSRLIVNNNKNTNGGFTFKKYYWIVDGIETEGAQIYSTGSDLLSTSATYAARLITTTDEEMNVCPARITLRASASIDVYPNPVLASNTFNIRVNNASENMNYTNSKVDIYSTSGNLVTSTKLAGEITSVNAPRQSGIYIVKIVCGELVREFKVNVK